MNIQPIDGSVEKNLTKRLQSKLRYLLRHASFARRRNERPSWNSVSMLILLALNYYYYIRKVILCHGVGLFEPSLPAHLQSLQLFLAKKELHVVTLQLIVFFRVQERANNTNLLLCTITRWQQDPYTRPRLEQNILFHLIGSLNSTLQNSRLSPYRQLHLIIRKNLSNLWSSIVVKLPGTMTYILRPTALDDRYNKTMPYYMKHIFNEETNDWDLYVHLQKGNSICQRAMSTCTTTFSQNLRLQTAAANKLDSQKRLMHARTQQPFQHKWNTSPA